MDLYDIEHFLKRKYFKITRGIDCCELFNYDSYLTIRIAKELRIFAKHTFGHPPYLTMEEWEKKLFSLADKLEIEKYDNSKKEAMHELAEIIDHLWI